jgi:hypothetical protein
LVVKFFYFFKGTLKISNLLVPILDLNGLVWQVKGVGVDSEQPSSEELVVGDHLYEQLGGAVLLRDEDVVIVALLVRGDEVHVDCFLEFAQF